MIKQKISFAGQDVLQSCSRNQMIVALEPLIPLLSDKGGIMSSFQRALVIYYSKEGIPVVTEGHIFSVFRQAIYHGAIVVAVAFMGHKGRHVQLLRERDECGDLLILDAGMLEALQMKTRHDRQLFHRELLRAFLISLAIVTFDLCRRT